MIMWSAITAGIFILAAFGFWRLLASRNMQHWIGPYIKHRLARRELPAAGGTDVYFCLADHYEPFWGGADQQTALKRVKRWHADYPKLAAQHRDSSGNPPQHSFFYPEEEYDEEILNLIKAICDEGVGDVDIHLHHDRDTAEGLEWKLNRFKKTLWEKHGLLRKDPDTGELVYSFIHGNWALDNSHPQGHWCGVDNELDVLVRTGCVMDMTMPSAPSPTQTRKINSIYFAKGRDGCRKSHDQGRDVATGEWGSEGELLMLQGPLELNWAQRKLGILPKLESAELSSDAPPTPERVRLWGKCAIHVKGADNCIFIKIHTHGANDRNLEMLLGGGLETLWNALEAEYRDREGFRLHYVSAWQMYNKVKELAGG